MLYRFSIMVIIVSWLVALSAEARQFTHEHHVCKLANGLSRMVLGILTGKEENFPPKWKLEASAKQLNEITDKCKEHPDSIEIEQEYESVDVPKRQAVGDHDPDA